MQFTAPAWINKHLHDDCQMLCLCAVRHFLMSREQVERLERCSVYCACVCLVLGRAFAGHRCTAGGWLLWTLISQSPTTMQYMEKSVSLWCVSKEVVKDLFEGIYMQMSYLREDGEPFTPQTPAFCIRPGSVGWIEGKRQGDGGGK